MICNKLAEQDIILMVPQKAGMATMALLQVVTGMMNTVYGTTQVVLITMTTLLNMPVIKVINIAAVIELATSGEIIVEE